MSRFPPSLPSAPPRSAPPLDFRKIAMIPVPSYLDHLIFFLNTKKQLQTQLLLCISYFDSDINSSLSIGIPFLSTSTLVPPPSGPQKCKYCTPVSVSTNTCNTSDPWSSSTTFTNRFSFFSLFPNIPKHFLSSFSHYTKKELLCPEARLACHLLHPPNQAQAAVHPIFP